MKAGVKAAVLLIGGGLTGLVSAQLALPYSGDAMPGEAAPWMTYGARETPQPYQRAQYLLSGRLPPPPQLILEAEAESDGTGATLNAGCTYKITLAAQATRWWRLAVRPGSGAISAGLALSAETGVTQIAISTQPQAGNWLKPADAGRFKLIFTAARGADTPGTRLAMPTIDRVDCH